MFEAMSLAGVRQLCTLEDLPRGKHMATESCRGKRLRMWRPGFHKLRYVSCGSANEWFAPDLFAFGRMKNYSCRSISL